MNNIEIDPIEQTLANFQSLEIFIKEMNSSNSSLEKLEVLKQYQNNQFIKDILFYTYNPFKNYYVTSENCLKRESELCEGDYVDIFELLNDLNSRHTSGHVAIAAVNSFAGLFSPIVYKIVDRNLEIRIDVKTINKVFKDLIPTYSVALAETLNDKTASKVNLEKDKWLVSRKLDGVRCQVIIDENGNINTYSREGKEFKTLDKIKQQFEKFAEYHKGLVFDGEICIVKESGEDDFAGVMRQIMKKNYIIENVKYYTFDCMPLEVFNGKARGLDFSSRIAILKRYVEEDINSPYLVVLPQTHVKNDEELSVWKQRVADNNWEGLILRKDCEYKGKRSFDLIKIKTWNDEDFQVIRTENGPFRVIVKGVEETIQTMTNIVVEYEGGEVSCGSGFSLDQRKEFFKYPFKIVGQMVTIKYFEKSYTTNKDGEMKSSLRFPIFKCIRNYE